MSETTQSGSTVAKMNPIAYFAATVIVIIIGIALYNGIQTWNQKRAN